MRIRFHVTVKIVLLILLVSTLGWGVLRILNTKEVPEHLVDDYSQYWSAGRLNLAGGNPYSAEQLLSLQRELKPDLKRVTRMWNPPLALTIAMPFALLPYPAARFLWFAFHLVVIFGCLIWLLRQYSREPLPPYLIGVLALGFPASLFVLTEGHISGIMLLGLVGFLYFQRRNQDFAGGMCAVLTLVKPHFLLLFWVALGFRSIDRRNFSAIGGAVFAVVLMHAWPWLTNPSVFSQYIEAVRANPPYYWVTATLGALLRLSLGWDKTWLTFLPPAIGVVWMSRYYLQRRKQWDWGIDMNPIVLGSVMLAAYGWGFDQVVLLIPVVSIIAHCNACSADRFMLTAVGILIATSLYGFFLTFQQKTLVADFSSGVDTALIREGVLARPNSFWFVLVPPLLCVAYALSKRQRPETDDS